MSASPGSFISRAYSILAFCCLFVLPMFWSAQATPTSQNFMTIDASEPFAEPPTADFHGGAATSPTGDTIGLNARYLTLNGKPWLPVMGEFHYSRYPEERWEEEILKMKADGVQIIATYIFWIHHEEIEGKFNWIGQRDLRHFVELCAKHGMYVYPRVGPWAHGEARNGGFPDWLIKNSKTRCNDPAYLSYVERYFGQIGTQLKGLLWKDGGPVIGIQLENEYSSQGAGAGKEHILTLKKLARKSGLDVPLYTITGWGDAAIPRSEVLPVFGGYPDAPWDSSLQVLPASEVYLFRFGDRASGNMGAMGAKAVSDSSKPMDGATPFLTAEMGGGVQDTYHRRPVITADDVAAMYPVMLGSGVNLYGFYMFQGGENPSGELSTLQESQVTGYPTDVPVKSYDFQAPLSEFGEERESFKKLKLFNYFLNDYGSYLAPMIPHAPVTLAKSPADLSVTRASVRCKNDQGFLFINNYVRDSTMPVRRATQFVVKLPGELLRIPRTPVDIPSGAYFIWPFNLDLGGARIKYSTAQLFTHITDGDSTIVVFFAIPGIAPEFAIDAASVASIRPGTARTERSGSVIYVRGIRPGLKSEIEIIRKTGTRIRILVLEKQEAEDAWKVTFDGKPHLIVTAQQIFVDKFQMHLRALSNPHFSFTVIPELTRALRGSRHIYVLNHPTGSSKFEASVANRSAILAQQKIQNASTAAPPESGPPLSWRPKGVARAPVDGAFQRAAGWQIQLPADAMKGLSDLFLKVDYVGDVARLSSSGKLLTDNFYNGLVWSVGLSRFIKDGGSAPLVLSILPLRKDAPIYIEDALRPKFSSGAQIDELRKLELIPEYELLVDTN